MEISLSVNEQLYSADVEARLLLADFLRDELNLTGTKIGCETGQCGACAVLLDGVSVKSCLMLAVQANGRAVTTVEGLNRDEKLNLLQEGFRERHGVQCGFCTPGMLVSLTDLMHRNPNPGETEIRNALEGNLCRCTGYQNVVRAVLYALEKFRSPVCMIVDTPGKEFYQRQVEFLISKDVDRLVDENYNENAVLTSSDFIVRGKPALKEHFTNYFKWVTIKEVKSTDIFVETDNTILFEATVESNYGPAKVYDAFVLRDGKIDYHFTGVK
jgi:carbon-monoxide dehydrogenase small subunit